MRILHAPRNISNQPTYMARALRDLGHESEVWIFGESRFAFPCDRTIDVSESNQREVWRHFMDAIERFDVFHFHFGQSFFPHGWAGMPPLWDVPVLRMLGKKVFVSYWGSDARRRKVLETINPWGHLFLADNQPNDDRIEKSIHVWRTYANRMFVHSTELLPHVAGSVVVERSFDLQEWPQTKPADRKCPVLLHVPSKRATKGTDLIVEGIDRLKAGGLKFEFRLLENMSHAEVKGAIRDADVLIDQLLVGDFGIISVEAMASSRVSVAYLLDDVMQAYPDLPVYDVKPDAFVDRMRELIRDRKLRQRLAQAGRPFVKKHFSASTIARHLIGFYEQEPCPVAVRAFPDWFAFGDQRKIEHLDGRIATVEQQRDSLLGQRQRMQQQIATLREEVLELKERSVAEQVIRKLRRK